MRNEEFVEEIYDEDMLYEKAVGAAKVMAIIGVAFGVLAAIAMMITKTQEEGILGLLYTVIATVPALAIAAVLFFVATGGLVYGWRFFTPLFDFVGWFLYLPIVGWFIFFAIKFFVSICVGWLFFGFQVVIRFIDKQRDKKETLGE